SVPVNVCGNAAAVLGWAAAGCEGGAAVIHTDGASWGGWGGPGDVWITSGDNSILGGNQINAPVSVPVNICGNAAAVLGSALAGCRGGAAVTHTDAASPAPEMPAAHTYTASHVVRQSAQLPTSNVLSGVSGLTSLLPVSSLPVQTGSSGTATATSSQPVAAS